MTATVSIRLSLQDAEVVRVALEKLGNDGQAALKKLDAAKLVTPGLGAIDKTIGELKSSLEGSAAPIGALGTLLTGLGPVGLVAAAGIGGVVAIMYEMSKAANELGQRATAIVNFSEAVGFNTTQVQALNEEGAKFRLNNEQIAQGLQHLATNLEPAHRAQGQLYEDLHRINPELAHQIANARDVGAAYDILGRAIRQALNAGDVATANALGRAAFGRNPGQQVNLAADVSAQGGVNALATSYANAGKALDEGLLKHLSELKNEIEQTNQRAKDLAASLFSEEVLNRELQAAQAWERMAKAAKDMADATKNDSFWQRVLRVFAKMGAVETGNPDDVEAIDRDTVERFKQRQKLEEGLRALGQRRLAEMQGAAPLTDVPLPQPRPTQNGPNAYEALANQKKLVSGLGSAATPAEQLRLKVLELDVALKDQNIDLSTYNRSLGAFKDAQMAAAEGARERLGLASQDEILSARLIQIKKDEADGYFKSEAEKQAAIERTRRASEDAFKQEQVRNSRTPGLTQLGQFSLDDKAVDQLATGTLDKLDSTMVTFINDTNKGGDAWRKFGLSAVEAIEQATIKALILAPIARSMAGLFSGGFGFGGGGGAGGGGIDPSATFADGGIMTSFGPLALRRYASGGVATGPQLALFGEGRQNEAFVPLPDGRAIPVRIAGGGGGRPAPVEQHFHVHIDGARGSREIQDAVHAGMQQAIGHSAALLKAYDKAAPARLADMQQRFG